MQNWSILKSNPEAGLFDSSFQKLVGYYQLLFLQLIQKIDLTPTVVSFFMTKKILGRKI